MNVWDRIAAIRRANRDAAWLVSEWLMVLGLMTTDVPVTHERIDESLKAFPGLNVRA